MFEIEIVKSLNAFNKHQQGHGDAFFYLVSIHGDKILNIFIVRRVLSPRNNLLFYQECRQAVISNKQ